jgi:membrane-bound lytic murein transglycosylase A
VDKSLHVYGTPFFIVADLPSGSGKATVPFRRLMIAQDTGSAIVGPARADLFFGAGDDAGRVAGQVRQPGQFAMLVPRDIDPAQVGAAVPEPLPRPPFEAQAKAQARAKAESANAPVARSRARAHRGATGRATRAGGRFEHPGFHRRHRDGWR